MFQGFENYYYYYLSTAKSWKWKGEINCKDVYVSKEEEEEKKHTTWNNNYNDLDELLHDSCNS